MRIDDRKQQTESKMAIGGIKMNDALVNPFTRNHQEMLAT